MGRHGHRREYLIGCVLCAQRSATYTTRLRRRRYAQRVEIDGRWVSLVAPRHGTHTGYVAYGCRCPECSTAQREANRSRYQRKAKEGEHDVVVP